MTASNSNGSPVTKFPLAFAILRHRMRTDKLQDQEWRTRLDNLKKNSEKLEIPLRKFTDFSARIMYSIITKEAIPLNPNGTAMGMDEVIALHVLASEIPDELLSPNGELITFLTHQATEYVNSNLGTPQEIRGFSAILTEYKSRQINAMPATPSHHQLAA